MGKLGKAKKRRRMEMLHATASGGPEGAASAIPDAETTGGAANGDGVDDEDLSATLRVLSQLVAEPELFRYAATAAHRALSRPAVQRGGAMGTTWRIPLKQAPVEAGEAARMTPEEGHAVPHARR